ncbi:hypothetical protein K437DRAFT_267827 [Tilletiaria anomala UBC 951]|uniref:SEC7 domain-containing protein n=1 Tax=Tilletiaria anomala (strain ATCC 24038 / CBS 436.72 / UBC 951) TaxID=1037660 RepID=A0A066W0P2_TILAU|nr:uncharacterized protein K437DRAFT_267827 [Tilletiaria anomala UBC 951]KDN47537.1 hypothetical protein K437DRAFT_267827 [Tilletiaria anomala UBC 951]
MSQLPSLSPPSPTRRSPSAAKSAAATRSSPRRRPDHLAALVTYTPTTLHHTIAGAAHTSLYSSADDFHSLIQPSPSASSAGRNIVYASPPLNASTAVTPRTGNVQGGGQASSSPPASGGTRTQFGSILELDAETETEDTSIDGEGDLHVLGHQRFVTAGTGTIGTLSKESVELPALDSSSASDSLDGIFDRFSTAKSVLPGLFFEGSGFLGDVSEPVGSGAGSAGAGTGAVGIGAAASSGGGAFKRLPIPSRSRPGTGSTSATFTSAPGDFSSGSSEAVSPFSSAVWLPEGNCLSSADGESLESVQAVPQMRSSFSRNSEAVSTLRRSSDSATTPGPSSTTAAASAQDLQSKMQATAIAPCRGENSTGYDMMPYAASSSKAASKLSNKQGTTSDAPYSSSYRYVTPPDEDDPLTDALDASDLGRTPRMLNNLSASSFFEHSSSSGSSSGGTHARERDHRSGATAVSNRDSLDPNRYARAVGTASSPDLKTLVHKKALEAVAQGRMSGEMARGILGDAVLRDAVAASASSGTSTGVNGRSAMLEDPGTATSFELSPGTSEYSTNPPSDLIEQQGLASQSPKVPLKDLNTPPVLRPRRKTAGSSSREGIIPHSISSSSSAGGAAGSGSLNVRVPGAARSSSNLPLAWSAGTTGRNYIAPDASIALNEGGSTATNSWSQDNSSTPGIGINKLAISTSTSGSLSLADEIDMGSPKLDEKGAGGGLFKGRMKKTSGFLRSLRPSARAKGQEPATLMSISNASGTDLLDPPTPSRRSFNGQTSAFEAGYAAEEFEGATNVPVPSIPSKYARETNAATPGRTSSSSSATAAPSPTGKTSRRDKGLAPAPPPPAAPPEARRPSAISLPSQAHQALGPAPGRPPRASVPASSAPASASALAFASASSNTSASDAARRSSPALLASRPSQPSSSVVSDATSSAAVSGSPGSWDPRRKTSTAAGGSDGTGQELRTALKAWESEMENTLRGSAQDLEKKIDLSPRAQWSPSPQLPEIDALEKRRSKSGSFMDGAKWEQSAAVAAAEPRTAEGDEESPSTPMPGVRVEEATPLAVRRPGSASRNAKRSRSLASTSDSEAAAAGLGILGTAVKHEEPKSTMFRSASAGPDAPRNSLRNIHPASASGGRVVSDSVAATRGHASSDAPSRKHTASPASSDVHSYAPEQSIRVIPRRDSVATTEGNDAPSIHSATMHKPLPVPGDMPSIQRQPSPGLSDVTRDEVAASERMLQRAQDMAGRAWKEDKEFMPKDKIAEWLGGPGVINKLARTAYFQNFTYEGLRVDVAFRRLCDRLYLKAETQQVDRILEAFSQRFWTCNPGSIYGSADTVHSIVFSLLLLNTDLHVADITDRMTRGQFIRNTMSAVDPTHGADVGSLGGADDSQSTFSENIGESSATLSLGRKPTLRGNSATLSPSGGSMLSLGHESSSYSMTNQSSPNLMSQPSRKASGNTLGAPPSANRARSVTNGSLDSTRGHSKAWEVEMESLLKDIYAAVKSDQIRLPEIDAGKGTLSPPAVGRRARGMASPGSDRISMLKRGSIRGIQGLLGASSSTFNSEGTISPGSSTNTGASLGVDSWAFGSTTSFANSSGTNGQQPNAALGFASTLTQTIIKESQDEYTHVLAGLEHDDLTDEELALFGPPWAKEGVLPRKHYWEASQKRAKDKNWLETFVVVQKGMLSMFRFGDTSSVRGSGPKAGTAVGGGNWLTNATSLGTINLAHTLANVLPPPGYNRNRPHVFALTLPGGAVYFFQAGHEELVHEWVSTCNYWAARQSKEPLAGGVSNMEYGWNKVLPSNAQSDEEEQLDNRSILSGPDANNLGASIYNSSDKDKTSTDNRSVRSGRSGKSKGGGSIYMPWQESSAFGSLTARTGAGSIFNSSASVRSPSLAGTGSGGIHANERIYINDWKNPQLPSVPSNLKEDEQLERVVKHVAHIESELTAHNELRQPMLQLYSPRGANYGKALANWERKSNHLLQELVKYQCYAESLRNAVRLRAEKRSQKLLERADIS